MANTLDDSCMILLIPTTRLVVNLYTGSRIFLHKRYENKADLNNCTKMANMAACEQSDLIVIEMRLEIQTDTVMKTKG